LLKSIKNANLSSKLFFSVLVIAAITFSFKNYGAKTLIGETLIGEITAEQLTSNFKAFDYTDKKHLLSEETIIQLTKIKDTYTIKAFFGTWCHDSEREIPALLDIIEAAQNPNLQLSLIALDMDKEDPKGLAKQYQVKYTPTIVIEAKGKELGRIVERPDNSLEDNILSIINSSTGE
jgi:thiol-disulfide isomerase/thioredoxin